MSRLTPNTEERVSRDSTARQSFLLLNTSTSTHQKAPSRRRPSGPGLVLAVILSMTLWLGLFWLAGQIFALLS